MGTATAIERAEQIRRELREYDLAHSKCPIDRRIAEKRAEARAQEAQAAQAQKNTQNWTAYIDNRIMQYLDHYCLHVFEHDEKDKRSIMTGAIGEMFGLERRDRHKELKAAIEELERRLAGKLVELREHLHQSTPGRFPLVKTWREESVVYQGELVSHRGSLWQAQRDTAQAPGGSDWVCVARHGRDAITPVVGGSYDVLDIVKTAIEDVRQSVDAKLAALEQASNDRWAVIDQSILQRIERARESVLQGTSEALGQFRAELKEFKPTLEEKEQEFEAKLAALEERVKSVPGKLPVAKTWREESVTYQTDFVSHNGSLYQACKDTAQAPGGSDWVCVSRHGRDAITPTVCGAYDVNQRYGEVSFDGCAYIARSDDPGLCPGDGWEPLSTRGQRGRRGEAIRGPQGEKGVKGDKGDDALEIVNWHIDSGQLPSCSVHQQREAGKAAGTARTFRAIPRRSGTLTPPTT